MNTLVLLFILLAAVSASKAAPPSQVSAEFCTILEDPLHVPWPIRANINLDPIMKVLEGSTISNLVAEGFSTLKYILDINPLLLSLDFDLLFEHGNMNASYQLDGYINAKPISQATFPSGNFTGFGLGQLSVTGLRMKGHGNFTLSNTNVNLYSLHYDILSFQSLTVDFGPDLSIACEKPDWQAISRDLKENFDREFPQFKAELTEKIRVAVNSVFQRFTKLQIVEHFRHFFGPCQEKTDKTN